MEEQATIIQLNNVSKVYGLQPATRPFTPPSTLPSMPSKKLP
jgi:hypothetical protein